MSDQLDLDRVTEKMKAPAKAWKNKWRVRGDCTGGVCAACGKFTMVVAPGQIYWAHCTVWPSKEIAEQKAADFIAEENSLHEYLGAFPVEAA